MDSARDKNHLIHNLGKFVWIPPEISLLDLQKSEGKFPFGPVETTFSSRAATGFASWTTFGEDVVPMEAFVDRNFNFMKNI